MSSSVKLDRALQQLRDRGSITGQAGVGPDGLMRIVVDDEPLTFNEIYAMAGMPLEPVAPGASSGD